MEPLELELAPVGDVAVAGGFPVTQGCQPMSDSVMAKVLFVTVCASLEDRHVLCLALFKDVFLYLKGRLTQRRPLMSYSNGAAARLARPKSPAGSPT